MKKDSLNTINSTIALILVVVTFYLAQWAITAGLLWVISYSVYSETSDRHLANSYFVAELF